MIRKSIILPVLLLIQCSCSSTDRWIHETLIKVGLIMTQPSNRSTQYRVYLSDTFEVNETVYDAECLFIYLI